MTPEGNIALVELAYGLRAADEKKDLRSLWADGAEYRMVGQPDMLPGLPIGWVDGPGAVEKLMDLFKFHTFERVDTVASGDRVAVRWRLNVSYKDQEPVDTEIFDFWRMTEDGKIKELIQFADTALMARMIH